MIDKIAASYGRTSKEKDDAFSVSSQLKSNREYASRNSITLSPEYEFPEDFSGKAPPHERPEYKKILALIRSRKIQMLIVYATDRFARDIVVGGTMLNELIKHRIELHIVAWNGPFRDTPEDWARFNFEMTFSDFERRKIIERTQRGKREMLSQHIWVANGPVDKYGFRRTGKKHDSHLVHVSEEVEIIRSLFDALDTGQRVRDLVRSLNASGAQTPAKAKGHRNGSVQDVWSRHMVYRILRDEAYIGVFYAYKQSESASKRLRPKDEWERLEFPELAVIDRAQFTRVQHLLNQGRERYAPDPTNEYLLARRIRCLCGRPIASETNTYRGKRYRYYRCLSNRPSKQRSACPIPNVRADITDQRIWERLAHFLRSPEEQLATLTEARHQQEIEYAEAIDYMARIEQIRTTYERELKAYYEDYREGLITKNIYKEKKAELDHRLEDAEDIFQRYQTKLAGKLLTTNDITDIMRDLAALREELEQLGELTFEKKRQLIERMNITGQMTIEGDSHVLLLYAHRNTITHITLGEVFGSTSRQQYCRMR